jgi:type IV pilus assembly protein PilW
MKPQSTTLQRGASLIEIMVGIVIGMIAILVIYQVFAAAEGVRRNTTGAGDAQQNGLLSSFALGIELANAGNSIATAAQELYGCNNLPTAAAADPMTSTSVRPLPVLIADSGVADTPDEFRVFYSASRSLVVPIDLQKKVVSGEDVVVQSPLPTAENSFRTNDMIVAINAGNQCTRAVVTGVAGPDADGYVTLSNTVKDGAGITFTTDGKLLNLGPANRVQRVRYYVDPVKNVLYSQNLFDPDAAPVPLASGIVNMKLQYGIDTTNDGFIDRWVSAGDADWGPATMERVPASWDDQQKLMAKVSQIKAIRIGIVTRSDQFDRDVTDDFKHTLFDCPSGGPCAEKIDVTAPKNWRYRVFETVIPLRNAIWNPTLL